VKLCIVGAGAIGGFLGGRLARAGHDVSLIARGPHLQALRRDGLRVIEGEEDYTVHPQVTDNPAEVGPAEAVIITLKAHSLPAMAERLIPLLGAETPVVTAMNGLPWWYFERHGGAWEGTRLYSLDPDGAIGRVIAPERVIGCVVYPSAEVARPGVIRHIGGDRFTLGEPDGQKTERVTRLADAFIKAGLKAPVRSRIRNEIWVKLMGNMVFNPLAALTGATLGRITSDPEARALAKAIMEEAAAVCARLDIEVDVTPEQRIAGAAKLASHKPSMLQDLEAGRPLELEALVGSVLELGRIVGVDMPHTATLHAAVKLRWAVRDAALVAARPEAGAPHGG
jgi:2-dehydropantoate 2-reductase